MDSIKKIKNQNLMASAGNLIIGPWLDLPSGQRFKTKICHWAQNDTSAMTVENEWSKVKRRSTNMDLERFCMEECSLNS